MDLLSVGLRYLDRFDEDEARALLSATVPGLRVVSKGKTGSRVRICYREEGCEQNVYVHLWRTAGAVAAKVADTVAGFGATKSSDPERVLAHLREVKGVVEFHLDTAGRRLASVVAGELVQWVCREFDGLWLWQTDVVCEGYWD